MTVLKNIELLEQEYYIGQIMPRTVNVLAEELPQEILTFLFELVENHSPTHFFQLKAEELISMANWHAEMVIEAVYLSLAQQSWPIYMYLEKENLLIITQENSNCLLFSDNNIMIEELGNLAKQYNLLFIEKQKNS